MNPKIRKGSIENTEIKMAKKTRNIRNTNTVIKTGAKIRTKRRGIKVVITTPKNTMTK